jgi:hypothetical protein
VAIAVAAVLVVVALPALGAPGAAAVPTAIAIDTTAIDFGNVAIGSTAERTVTVTNTGTTSFGPLNMFGGAPPSPVFDASQSCQGKTLPAGGSCQITYEFSPTAAGLATDTSSFTISPTTSQSNGEDFTVTLRGTGTTATTTTSTSSTTTTTRPTTTTQAGGSGGGGGSGGQPDTPADDIPSDTAPDGEASASVELPEVAPGQEERATVQGLQPGELVSAVLQPDGDDLGSRVADTEGVARFSWTIDDDAEPGEHRFEATATSAGTLTATYAVVAADDDSDDGISPWLIALLVVLAVAIVGAITYLVLRSRRHPNEPPAPPTPATP